MNQYSYHYMRVGQGIVGIVQQQPAGGWKLHRSMYISASTPKRCVNMYIVFKIILRRCQ